MPGFGPCCGWISRHHVRGAAQEVHSVETPPATCVAQAATKVPAVVAI